MSRGFLQHLKYGNVDRDVYKKVLPLITEENNKTMCGLTQIEIRIGWVLVILSYLDIFHDKMLPAYLYLLISAYLFKLVRKFIPQQKVSTSHFFCLSQGITLVLFGILNSTIFAPNATSNGTIFMVLLLVFPFLMISVPYEMDALLILLTTCYCILTYIFKDPCVHRLDTINAISVCIIAIMANWIFSAKNMENIVNKFYLKQEHDTDPLTGLFTKQAGKTLIQSNLNSGINGALFVIDMDNFKSINDEHGHLYGDLILRKLSNCIKENVSEEDIASRFGGDEFVIFYPGLSKEGSEEISKNFKQTIKATFEKEKHTVTCSLGVAVSNSYMDYDSLFEVADSALYESKNKGKDLCTIK